MLANELRFFLRVGAVTERAAAMWLQQQRKKATEERQFLGFPSKNLKATFNSIIITILVNKALALQQHYYSFAAQGCPYNCYERAATVQLIA